MHDFFIAAQLIDLLLFHLRYARSPRYNFFFVHMFSYMSALSLLTRTYIYVYDGSCFPLVLLQLAAQLFENYERHWVDENISFFYI